VIVLDRAMRAARSVASTSRGFPLNVIEKPRSGIAAAKRLGAENAAAASWITYIMWRPRQMLDFRLAQILRTSDSCNPDGSGPERPLNGR
jgi:hypothetical protein